MNKSVLKTVAEQSFEIMSSEFFSEKRILALQNDEGSVFIGLNRINKEKFEVYKWNGTKLLEKIFEFPGYLYVCKGEVSSDIAQFHLIDNKSKHIIFTILERPRKNYDDPIPIHIIIIDYNGVLISDIKLEEDLWGLKEISVFDNGDILIYGKGKEPPPKLHDFPIYHKFAVRINNNGNTLWTYKRNTTRVWDEKNDRWFYPSFGDLIRARTIGDNVVFYTHKDVGSYLIDIVTGDGMFKRLHEEAYEINDSGSTVETGNGGFYINDIQVLHIDEWKSKHIFKHRELDHCFSTVILSSIPILKNIIFKRYTYKGNKAVLLTDSISLQPHVQLWVLDYAAENAKVIYNVSKQNGRYQKISLRIKPFYNHKGNIIVVLENKRDENDYCIYEITENGAVMNQRKFRCDGRFWLLEKNNSLLLLSVCDMMTTISIFKEESAV